MLVRVIAAALIGWSVAELTLYVLVCRHNAVPVAVIPCVIRSIPFVGGVVILVKARAIAEWVADKLDL